MQQRSERKVYLAILAGLGGMTACSHVASAAGTIGVNFSGVNMNDVGALTLFNVSPPDTMGSVGPSHYVEFVNNAFAIYNKTGTVAQAAISDATFWQNAGITSTVTAGGGGTGLTDPRIIYDPNSSRWYAIEINTTATNNQILVGRSNSSDPTAGWKAVNFTGQSGNFGDFPTLGIDANGVYIGTNNFTSSTGSGANNSIYSIPKTDLLAATPVVTNMTRFDNVSFGNAPQPVVDFSASKAAAVVISVPNFATNTSFLKRTITGTTAAGATLSSSSSITVTLPYSSPPEATQPGAGAPNIDASDQRVPANIYQVGNLAFLAHTVTPTGGTRASVRWSVLNLTTNTSVSEGTIADSTYDYFQPAIAVNNNGDVVLTYNRSSNVDTSATGNLSIYMQVGTSVGGVLTFQPAQLISQSSISNYNTVFSGTERWGDYSSVTIDPTNQNSFWAINEIPLSSSQWSTQITQITVPEPGMLSIATLGLGGLLLRRRRQLARAGV
jgi:hypothetical protein